MTSLYTDCPLRVLKLSKNLPLKNCYFPPANFWKYFMIEWWLEPKPDDDPPRRHLCFCWKVLIMSSADNDVSRWVLLILLPPACLDAYYCSNSYCKVLRQIHGLQALLLYEHLGTPVRNLAPLFPKPQSWYTSAERHTWKVDTSYPSPSLGIDCKTVSLAH